jgi:hypothetical protein
VSRPLDWTAVVADLERRHPGFRVEPKERHPVIRALFRNFTLSLGRTVYMDAALIGTPEGAATLRHEAVHVDDWARFGPLLWISQLLLPVGPSLRAVWEWRAYRESMRVELERRGALSDAYLARLERIFTGPRYAWMFPVPPLVRALLRRERDRVVAERDAARRACYIPRR